MKFKLRFGLPCVILLLFVGCNQSKNEMIRIIEERDSLMLTTERQQRRLNTLDTIMTLINSGLDSISRHEQMLFVDMKIEGGISRTAALKNIENLSTLIKVQKQKITNLESHLAEVEKDDGVDNILKQTIAHFKAQLTQKDMEITSLKKQLEQKEIDIAALKSRVGSQALTIAELDKRNARQVEALERQDAILNHCYLRIADKKTLEGLGIVKKGKLVAQGALDRSKFSKVDIRTFKEIEFDAKHPRILTAMPTSAYLLTTNGKNHYILQITNPSEFWRVSNYLVIQTN